MLILFVIVIKSRVIHSIIVSSLLIGLLIDSQMFIQLWIFSPGFLKVLTLDFSVCFFFSIGSSIPWIPQHLHINIPGTRCEFAFTHAHVLPPRRAVIVGHYKGTPGSGTRFSLQNWTGAWQRGRAFARRRWRRRRGGGKRTTALITATKSLWKKKSDFWAPAPSSSVCDARTACICAFWGEWRGG